MTACMHGRNKNSMESRDMSEKELVQLSESAMKEILEKCSGKLYVPEGEETGVIFVPKGLREKYGIRAVKARIKGNKLVIDGGVR